MKLIRAISLVFLCIFFVPSLAFGDPLNYFAEGDSVTITDCNESASGALVIPFSYNGKLVVSIGSYAFNSCSSLTSVTIPESVVSIGNMTFKNCSSLTSVIIGNNVTSIGRWAFKDCHNLTNVTIPDSVTQIGSWAFSGCSSLKSITFKGNAPSSFGSDVFKNLPIGATITVTAGATGFGETYGGLTVQILKKKLVIKSFNSHASPFSLVFETQLDATCKVEASHDLKKWSEIAEIEGTGSTVEFIDRRKALLPRQYYRVKRVE